MSSSTTVTPIATAAPSPSASSSTPLETGRRYRYFLKKDYNTAGAAPSFYKDIISTAKKKIQILDPYFHVSDAVIFSGITSRLDIEIVTMVTFRGTNATYLADTVSSIETDLAGNPNKTNTSVKICTIPDKYSTGTDHAKYDEWRFHDRMLIIDDKYFYLVGSSVEYHHDLKASTGIYEVYHVDDKNLMRTKYDTIKSQADTSSSAIYQVFV